MMPISDKDETEAANSPRVEKEATMAAAAFQRIFGRAPEVLAFAPAQLEFIGNHMAYSGGPVLWLSTNRRVWVGIAGRTDGQRRLATEIPGHGVQFAVVPTGSVERQPVQAAWIDHTLGLLTALPSFSRKVPAGFDYLLYSPLRTEIGLDFSAAIGIATTLAILRWTGQRCSRELIAQLGRNAERQMPSLPRGVSDPAVFLEGRKDHLVLADSREPEPRLVALPPGAHFWLLQTHTSQSIVTESRAARHAECMRIAIRLGVEDLSAVTKAQLESTFPDSFKTRSRRVQHVLGEIGRVGSVHEALAKGDLDRVGRLLTGSHRSSQYFFENSTPELDFLVDMLVETKGAYGARLTGGGFGGAVHALTDASFTEDQAGRVVDAYNRKFKNPPIVTELGSGEGARTWQPG